MRKPTGTDSASIPFDAPVDAVCTVCELRDLIEHTQITANFLCVQHIGIQHPKDNGSLGELRNKASGSEN